MAEKINTKKQKYGDSLTCTLYETESKSGNSYFRGTLKVKAEKSVRIGDEVILYFSTTANVLKSKFGSQSNVVLLNVQTSSI